MTEFQEKVLKLIKEGKSPSEVRRLLNCPRTSIASVLKTYNVPIEKRNYLHKKCKEDYFDIIDTDEKAYILGFFIAVGNIISSNIEGMGYCLEYHKGKTIDWYTLRFQTYGIDKPNKILKLYKFLYQDSKFSFKRKKDKMESYLKYLGKLEN